MMPCATLDGSFTFVHHHSRPSFRVFLGGNSAGDKREAVSELVTLRLSFHIVIRVTWQPINQGHPQGLRERLIVHRKCELVMFVNQPQSATPTVLGTWSTKAQGFVDDKLYWDVGCGFALLRWMPQGICATGRQRSRRPQTTLK